MSATPAPSTLDQIRSVLRRPGAQDHLDGVVHDSASALATATNNDGLKTQLEFLNARGMTDEAILALLEEATA